MDVEAKTLYLLAVARKTKATVKQGRHGSGATGAAAWLSSPAPPPPLPYPAISNSSASRWPSDRSISMRHEIPIVPP